MIPNNTNTNREPCLLLNITHGFQARLLLRSEVADRLLDAGCRLIVCSPNADEEYFANEFDHPNIVLEKTPTVTSSLEARLSTWRQYLLMNPALGATLNHKRETLRAEQPKRYAVTRAANLLLGNIPMLRRAYMSMEKRVFPAKEYDTVLKRYRPDLCVTGTPGFNVDDVHLLRACKRRNIPTACAMLSWDNLTSKGYMNGTPDHLLVWSDLMADEAQHYHDFPKDRIHWTGAAQFDQYHEAKSKIDRTSWRHEHRVPADAFMMMYGTINPGICPHEIEILRCIIQTMRAAGLNKTPYLWIRLHPQVVNGPWKRSLEQFTSLSADDVHVEIPPVNSSKLNWDLPKTDTEHLRNLIACSDVVVTTSSTLSIDAACADTPIANVFFDGIDVAPTVSVDRFRRYTHYAKILETGGIAQALTPNEFGDIMHRYAADPEADSQRRRAIIRQQLNALDGQSGKRTAERLIDLATQSQNAQR